MIYEFGGHSFAWKGSLNRYDGPGIDNQTRMIPCRVHVDQPLAVRVLDPVGDVEGAANPPTLMTGMFVKVRIHVRPPIQLVRVPPAAIQPGNVIWTVRDDTLHRTNVRIANSTSELVVAYQEKGGLQVGDAVVVSPVATPFEGMKTKELPAP